MADWLKILKDYIDTLETALGNPTGNMSAVSQSEASTLAAYLLDFRELTRAHTQSRICLVVPNLANIGSDLPNTAIKAELDEIGSVSLLDQTGVDDGQEDWAVYDLIVVGSNTYAAFTNTNLDCLVTMKLPVLVCNRDVAIYLKMGSTQTQSASDVNEYCESIANRVTQLVFGSVGEKEIFSEATVSDRLDMSDAQLTEQVLMVDTTADGNTKVVLGWLPMEDCEGTINQLDDATDLPAGRAFGGCFVNADKLTALGQLLLRRLARNFIQGSITPSINLKAQASSVQAILNDTADMQPKLGTPAASISADIAAIKAETATILTDTADIQPKLGTPAADISADIAAVKAETATIQLDIQVRRVASGSKLIGAGVSKYLEIDSGTNGAEIISIIINGVVSYDWTLETYVPTADAVAAPAAGDKRDKIVYLLKDTEGGLLHGFGIAYNGFLKFTNDSAGNQTISDVVVIYRSRAVLTLSWEA